MELVTRFSLLVDYFISVSLISPSQHTNRYLTFFVLHYRYSLAKINFCKRLKEERYSVAIAKERCLSSLLTNMMLEVAITIQAIRSA